ncbi:ABC transporter permease [Nocardioides limicola]|uniref:ABC transporter permease n=1 Tax=Nocardioides limicola TaxID=2803368 RepID=UPI00193B22BE|nr:ABC transporter permease [Nocardioides sp. DJM-14]
MSRWWAGWRAALRIAARDTRRARARSALVLALLMLPVVAVSTAAVMWATYDVASDEALERRVGAGEAMIRVDPGVTRVIQRFDPDDGHGQETGRLTDPTWPEMAAALDGGPGDRPVTALRDGWISVGTSLGSTGARAIEADFDSPLIEGLFRVTEGRFAATPDEVTVNKALAERGPTLGETLTVTTVDPVTDTESVRHLEIVGIVESTRLRSARLALSRPGGFGAFDGYQHGWLVGGDPVTWDDVLRLNQVGAAVVSRSVLSNPPGLEDLPEEFAYLDDYVDDTVLIILALIATMVLIEVVLLAGPAFAVGARRQARTLALMSATGGATPAQARRVVLASAVVLGVTAGLLGTLLGIGVAWLAVPAVAQLSWEYPGPFEVPWPVLGVVAGFGLISALLAALVPAWIASRQDPVLVLAGRRGQSRPSIVMPLIGVLVFGVGVALAVAGTRQYRGEFLIAVSAIVCVLGMVMLVPLVVSGVGRLVRFGPLPLRFAGRDAARHRTRTAPAVAAVAATVAGVVALGIAMTSDAAENRETYQPRLAHGWGQVHHPGDREAVTATIRQVAPEAEFIEVSTAGAYLEFHVVGEEYPREWWSNVLDGGVIVADSVPEAVPGFPAEHRAEADRALTAGGVVVLDLTPAASGRVAVVANDWDHETGEMLDPQEYGEHPLILVAGDGEAKGPVIISTRLAQDWGLDTSSHLLVDGLSRSQAVDAEEMLAVLDAGLYVERGYREDRSILIAKLLLGLLGGVLMLGGTITATALALADARPDLATMSAVGAPPRTRRRIATSYAVVVSLTGALLGVVVGFVPGWAISVPLTHFGDSGPFFEVPWLMIGAVVLGLPVLTAAVIAATARTRLPMVARLD